MNIYVINEDAEAGIIKEIQYYCLQSIQIYFKTIYSPSLGFLYANNKED